MRFLDEYILTKRCTSCGEVKVYADFHRAPRNAFGGRTAKCKCCRSAAGKQYWRRPEVQERRAEYSARPDVRAGRSEYMREYHRWWFARNRTRRQSQIQAWNRAHPEARREQKRQCDGRHRADRVAAAARWREQNRERYNAYHTEYVRRRRAARRGLPTEPISRQGVWDRDGGVCHICGQPCDPRDWHMDHIHPTARGGAHVMSNVAVSHPRCNLKKQARLMSELRRDA